MAETEYMFIAGFPNASFHAVALGKDGTALSEKTFKAADYQTEMESFLEAYPAKQIKMIGPMEYMVEYKKKLINTKFVDEHIGIPIDVLERH